jgi:hypothetical protein
MNILVSCLNLIRAGDLLKLYPSAQKMFPLNGNPGPPVKPPEQVGASPTFPFWTWSITSVEVEERVPVPVMAKMPSATAVESRVIVAMRSDLENCILDFVCEA